MGLGITIGRLLGFNYVACLFLGRLGNLFFFLFAGFYAIRRAPVGKEILFLIALLPITLQQAASMSGDGVMDSLALLLLGASLSLSMAERLDRHAVLDLLLALLCGILVGKAKYGACFPICLPLVLVILCQWKKRREIALCALAVLFASFLFGFLSGMYTVATEAHVTTALAVGRSYYKVGELIRDPRTLFTLLMNTILRGSDNYWIVMMGASLGWYTVQIPTVLIVLFVPLFFFAMLPDEDTREFLTRQQRIVLFLTGFFGIGVTAAGMLIGWTMQGEKIISGLQGRYFLPYLPALLFSFLPKRIRYANGEVPRRAAVFLGIFLETLIVEALFYRARVML